MSRTGDTLAETHRQLSAMMSEIALAMFKRKITTGQLESWEKTCKDSAKAMKTLAKEVVK